MASRRVDSLKILVVAPTRLVDCVAAQSLLQVLRQRHGGAQIDVLAPAPLISLFMRMPQVDNGIELDIDADTWAWQQRYRFGQALQQYAYDWALVLPLSLKSALIPMFAEIPRRTGWRGPMRFFLLNDIRLLIRRWFPLAWQQYATLAWPQEEPPPVDTLPRPRLHAKQDIPAVLQAGEWGDCAVVLCAPAANSPGLVEELVARDHRVILLGEQAELLAKPLPDKGANVEPVVSGPLDWGQRVDILARAGVVVGDGGDLLSLAEALQRPLLDLREQPDVEARRLATAVANLCRAG